MPLQVGSVLLILVLFVRSSISTNSEGQLSGAWGNWLLGGSGKSCTEACQDHAGSSCSEDHWPNSADDFKAVAQQANFMCKDIQTGIVRYDPSASGVFCGWQGESINGPRCWHHPPVSTRRFCFCYGVVKEQLPQPIPFSVIPVPPRYDCMIGITDWLTQWSLGKQSWCCEHEQRGCTTTTTTTTSTITILRLYDCNVGNQPSAWLPQKRAWCCQYEQRGCPTTSSELYNCFADQAHKASWSYGKKQWCCQTKNFECPFDCDVGFSDWKMMWAEGKSEWCCQHRGRGCSVALMKQ